MRTRFDEQLEQLNDELISMGKLIEEAIEIALYALTNKDMEQAQKAIDFDDEIDRKERDIEALCLKLLLRQQPVARDLRQVSAALKMITDMERIGDQAADISEIVIMIGNEPYVKPLEHLPMMAEIAKQMVIKSIEAYVKKDEGLVKEVLKMDDMVDDMFLITQKELIKIISENPDKGKQALDILMIAKYLERIGDHAENIAEWVEFSITGIHKGKLI
jgi:phosphate transport system protein